MGKKNEKITVEKINTNRKNYLDLFQDYLQMDSWKKIKERIRENEYADDMKLFLGLLGIDCIIYLITLFCFFKNHIIEVIVFWIIVGIINAIFICKKMPKLESYKNEMIEIRDNEICTLLRKNNITLQNISTAIDYFKLELEPINGVSKEYPILNSISSFGFNLFSLISGIVATKLIDIKLKQGDVQVFAIIMAVLVFILFGLSIVKIYIYFNKKDKYAAQTRKLIVELKRIELLNRE